ncbi:SRRM1 protein, partial [Acromyrmex charruanus]
MQINLTGFLNGRNARSFMGELWDLLVSAQESVTGIPEAFLQQKKDQIKKRLVIISFHLCVIIEYQKDSSHNMIMFNITI